MVEKKVQQRTFNHVMELFILPEITRRKKARILQTNFLLKAAQVLFYSDGRRPIVRLNEETKIIGEVKLKKGLQKRKGEKVLPDEIARLERIRLIDDEEPKYAHISMVRFGQHWLFGFDFRYNKGLAREHYRTAKQFCDVALYAHNNKLTAPFIDNLFNCIELIAKAELLLLPNYLKKKTTHKDIQIKYNNFVDMGNAKLDFKTALNKLSGLRISARYLKSTFRIPEIEAQEYLATAKEMLDYLESKLEKL